jgi:hypothetical protein
VDEAGNDGSGTGVYAQRYTADGTRAGGELRVTTTAGNQGYFGLAVGIDDFGRVALAYTSPDGDGNGIFLQRLDGSGALIGGEVRVNGAAAGNQAYPTLAVDPAGNFTVGWTHGSADLRDGDIYSQRFTTGGVRLGPEARMNASTAGRQRFPALALTPAGTGVVVWDGVGPDDNEGIFFQRFGGRG